MQTVKKAAEFFKMYPKLQLGEKIPGGGVKPTGPHTIKITAEPTTVMMNKGPKKVKGFKFVVQEGEKLFKWLVPLTNDDGTEGHYLIDRLQDVEIGEELVVEMKKRGARNYIEVRRAGDPEEEEEDVIEAEPTDEEVEAEFNQA